MSLLTIPTSNASTDGNFYMVITLDGAEYQLYFKYNAREDFWYLDVNDTDGNPIRLGMKLVVNFPVMRTCQLQTRPPGEIIVLDTIEPVEDPGLNDLDENVTMVYEEQSSLP